MKHEISTSITIGALSRATRIPVETLRTWERRYLSPIPLRKPSGHRLYPVAAVEQLRRVARLLEQGHRPAEIVRLSVPELDALLALGGEPPARAAIRNMDGVIDDLLALAARLDRPALLSELQSNWARLGPLDFLGTIAGPFLVRLGEDWQSGRIEVRHEHFASEVLGGFLRAMREPFEARAAGPHVVVATPAGEHHEGGLLMTALLLSLRGRRIVYLGVNTPLREIVGAARQGRAEAVVLSISSAMPPARARRFLSDLRRSLPRTVAVWSGGTGAPPDLEQVERFESLAGLDGRLARRRRAAAS